MSNHSNDTIAKILPHSCPRMTPTIPSNGRRPVITNQHKMPKAMKGMVGRTAPKNNQRSGIRNSKIRKTNTIFICTGYVFNLAIINSPCLLYNQNL